MKRRRASRRRSPLYPDGVVTGRYQELSGNVDANSETFEELGCERFDDAVIELIRYVVINPR